ncbi:MAG: hypothetical protein K2Y23_12960 [Cyanobacteria bacterium]|nr:hypothetical protein [Cyanobacteriota bacterium]
MTNARAHSWRFKTRFRRHAFGWKSQPAIARLQEALSEIEQVARLEPLLAAEGAIALLERISPALEHVDSSSGAIGSAVNRTIAGLVPVIVGAPAGARTRAAWLDRLFEAHAADQIPYLTAAANAGVDGAVRTRIRALFDDPAARSGFVARVIGKEVGLD